MGVRQAWGIDYDRDELLRFAPKVREPYLDALLSDEGKAELRKAGICDSALRFAHFFAQCFAETGGFRVIREDLNYKTVGAIRRAWKSRAKKHTDEWISENLLKNPQALGAWAYNGREGNRTGTTDGYDYRGAGVLQSTHRGNCIAYCKQLGIEPTPEVMDDIVITLKFACLEWIESDCNRWADENDLLAISRAINVGSAKSGVMPNGMDNRKEGLARAMAVWGDERAVSIAERSDATEKDLVDRSTTVDVLATVRTVAGGGAAVGGTATAVNEAVKETGWFDGFNLPQLVTDSTYVKMLVETSSGIIEVATRNVWLLLAILGVVGYVLARKLIARRIAEFRTGRYSPATPKQV